MRSSALLALAAASFVSAHYNLNYPPGAGDTEDEATGPCAKATLDFSSSSSASLPSLQVDQFAVSIQSSHPAGSWVFLGSTGTSQNNFTELVPIVNTTGPGTFCLTGLSAPKSFAGQVGILQVIDYSSDGALYRCAPVNWVSGANTTAGSSCTNQTGFSAIWTTSQASNTNSNSSTSSTPVPSSSTKSTSPSSTGGAAAMVTAAAGSVLGGMGVLVAAGLLL